MRGFIEENGSYYEADHPLSANDIPVGLRPSDAHTLGPGGKWILDRRLVTRIPTPREYAEQAYCKRAAPDSNLDDGDDEEPTSEFEPQQARYKKARPIQQSPQPMPMGYPYQQPPPRASRSMDSNADTAVRQTLFEFVARNWLAILSALIWMAGSSWVVAKQFYDMQTIQERQSESIKIIHEELKSIRTEAREQKDKAELMNKNNESRYNDLNLFLQSIASRNK